MPRRPRALAVADLSLALSLGAPVVGSAGDGPNLTADEREVLQAMLAAKPASALLEALLLHYPPDAEALGRAMTRTARSALGRQAVDTVVGNISAEIRRKHAAGLIQTPAQDVRELMDWQTKQIESSPTILPPAPV